MPTYRTSGVAVSEQARAGIDITSQTESLTIGTNLAASDILEMVKVPAGATIQEIVLSTTASLGATSTVEIGDGGDTDRFFAAANFGNGAQGLVRMDRAIGHGYKYTSEDTIDVRIATNGTPATGAVVTMTVIYTMQ
jgi:hypothetical protein